MKYYLKNKNNEKIVEFEMIMVFEDFAIQNAKVINDNLFPSFFCGDEQLNEKLGYYFDAVINEYVPDLPLYYLDDYIVNELGLPDRIKHIGRLVGAEYLVCYLKSHFKDTKYELYVTPEKEYPVSCLNDFKPNKIFLDKPVSWDNTNVI